jgi:hypothetical protein
MKKTLTILILFLSLNTFAQCYLIDPEIIAEVNDKKLLVELMQIEDTHLKGFTPENKEKYLSFVTFYNNAVQEILPTLWTLSKGGIEFKNLAEIEKIPNEQLSQYILFQSGWIEHSNQMQGSFLMYSFNIDYFNSRGKRTEIFGFSYVPDSFIKNADIVFVTKVLNNHVALSKKEKKYSAYFDTEKNLAEIKSKTLLLDKTNTELTPEELTNAYEHKAEIVDPERIASEIEKSSADHLFIKLMWSPSKSSAFYDVFDTKECNILTCLGTGGVRVSLGSRGQKWSGYRGTSNFYDADRYPYRNPFGGKETFSTQVFRSKLAIKKVHVRYVDSPASIKMSCK